MQRVLLVQLRTVRGGAPGRMRLYGKQGSAFRSGCAASRSREALNVRCRQRGGHKKEYPFLKETDRSLRRPVRFVAGIYWARIWHRESMERSLASRMTRSAPHSAMAVPVLVPRSQRQLSAKRSARYSM